MQFTPSLYRVKRRAEMSDNSDETEDDKRYEVIRFYDYNHPTRPDESEVIKGDLTLEEAREHCKDPGTRRDEMYFDGYNEE